MAALPAIALPSRADDRLPQPFRMLDKLLAELVERACALGAERERALQLEAARRIDKVRRGCGDEGTQARA